MLMFFAHRRRMAKRPVQKITRLELEELGARIVPAVTRTWTGLAGPNWSSPLNWNSTQGPGVPQADDTVIFDGSANVPSTVDAMFAGQITSMTIMPTYQNTITANRNLTISDRLTQFNGTIGVVAGQQVSTHFFDLVQGTVKGPGSLSVTGAAGNPGVLTLTDGTIDSQGLLVIDQISQMNINGAFTISSGTVTNYGLVNVNQSSFTLNRSGTFNNYGSFFINGDYSILTGGVGTNTYNNYGLFSKNAAIGTSTVEVIFNSQPLPLLPPNQVQAVQGKLLFSADGEYASQFIAQNGATIEFTASHILNAGTSFTGAGWVRVTSGGELSVPLGTSVDASCNFELTTAGGNAGKLTGDGVFNSLTMFKWTGGTIDDTFVVVRGQMMITGNMDSLISKSQLTIVADTVWDGMNDIKASDSTIFNLGRFEVKNDQVIRDVSVIATSFFKNHNDGVGHRGTFTKTAGTGVTTVQPIFENSGGDLRLNGRKIKFQGGIEQTSSESTTVLDNGTLIVTGTFNVTIGTLSGPGTIEGNLSLGGSLNLGSAAGTLTITGNYAESPNAILNIKIGGTGAGQFDRLMIGGTAALNATLNITLITGYTPMAGHSFKIVDATGGRTGMFNPVNFPPLGGGLIWNPPAYNPNDVTLSIRMA